LENTSAVNSYTGFPYNGIFELFSCPFILSEKMKSYSTLAKSSKPIKAPSFESIFAPSYIPSLESPSESMFAPTYVPFLEPPSESIFESPYIPMLEPTKSLPAPSVDPRYLSKRVSNKKASYEIPIKNPIKLTEPTNLYTKSFKPRERSQSAGLELKKIKKYSNEKIKRLMTKDNENFKNFKLSTSNYLKEKTGFDITGLYAGKDIKKNDIIVEYFGIIYDKKQDIEDIYNIYTNEFEVDPKNLILRDTETYDFRLYPDDINSTMYVDGSIYSHSSFGKFLNSSYPDNCMTNCTFKHTDDGKIIIKATRDIEKDEELFLTYGLNTPIIVHRSGDYFEAAVINDPLNRNIIYKLNTIVAITDQTDIVIDKDRNMVTFVLQIFDDNDEEYYLHCKTDIDTYVKKYTFGVDIPDELAYVCKSDPSPYKFNRFNKIISRDKKFKEELDRKLESIREKPDLYPDTKLNKLNKELYKKITGMGTKDMNIETDTPLLADNTENLSNFKKRKERDDERKSKRQKIVKNLNTKRDGLKRIRRSKSKKSTRRRSRTSKRRGRRSKSKRRSESKRRSKSKRIGRRSRRSKRRSKNKRRS